MLALRSGGMTKPRVPGGRKLPVSRKQVAVNQIECAVQCIGLRQGLAGSFVELAEVTARDCHH